MLTTTSIEVSCFLNALWLPAQSLQGLYTLWAMKHVYPHTSTSQSQIHAEGKYKNHGNPIPDEGRGEG